MMLLARMRRDRRGVTAVIFGVAGIAVTMMVGLVIDFSTFMSLRTQLSLAADAGVLAGVTQAATQLGPNPGGYISLGQQAGQTRFIAQSGLQGGNGAGGQITGATQSLTITRNGALISGTMTWSATYNTYFGKLFGVNTWKMSNVSASTVQVSTPYLNVYVVMDNSPSMEIGAANSDIQTLQQLTACSSSGAYYPNSYYATISSSGYWSNPLAQQSYSAYSGTVCSKYTGTLPCPANAPSPPLSYSTFPLTAPYSGRGPSCQGMLPVTNYNGLYPEAGAPCAFACHFDTSKASGTGNDYYSVARSTIGASNQVTLRLDVVKQAVNNLLTTMQSQSQVYNNLNVAIYTLDQAITKVYPATGDAGNGWATAIAAVGGPPTMAYGQDTGIQPYAGGDVADTDFPDALTALSQQLTPAGGGTAANDPQKVLVIITDGAEDYCTGGNTGGTCAGTRVLQALEPKYCQLFKDMNYTVFVLYTPYYPLLNNFYQSKMTSWAEGTGSTSITYNLQQCASGASDYLAATDNAGMTSALQSFLNIALNTPARLTK